MAFLCFQIRDLKRNICLVSPADLVSPACLVSPADPVSLACLVSPADTIFRMLKGKEKTDAKYGTSYGV